jgi:hypothetical protein
VLDRVLDVTRAGTTSRIPLDQALDTPLTGPLPKDTTRSPLERWPTRKESLTMSRARLLQSNNFRRFSTFGNKPIRFALIFSPILTCFLLGVGKIADYHLPTVTKPPSTAYRLYQLLAVGSRNRKFMPTFRLVRLICIVFILSVN